MKTWVLSHKFPSGKILYFMPFQGSFAFCQFLTNALKFDTKPEAEHFLEKVKSRNKNTVALHQLSVTEITDMN